MAIRRRPAPARPAPATPGRRHERGRTHGRHPGSRTVYVEAGGAVALGLGVVVGRALRFQVLERCRPAVCTGVEVVDLEAEASFAAVFGAAQAVEGGWWTEAERGAQLGGEVPAV